MGDDPSFGVHATLVALPRTLKGAPTEGGDVDPSPCRRTLTVGLRPT